MIRLSEQERMAIDSFLSEHWSEFCDVALNFLSTAELERLEEKLSTKG